MPATGVEDGLPAGSRYKSTKPSRYFIQIPGTIQITWTESDVSRWLQAIQERVALGQHGYRLTGLHWRVAEALCQLVLMMYEHQPSYQMIADRATANGWECSCRTVHRALHLLADAGFLRWWAQWDIGRAGCNTCRADTVTRAGKQARRAPNCYVLLLPPRPLIKPLKDRQQVWRPHTCDRVNRLEVSINHLERQDGAVESQVFVQPKETFEKEADGKDVGAGQVLATDGDRYREMVAKQLAALTAAHKTDEAMKEVEDKVKKEEAASTKASLPPITTAEQRRERKWEEDRAAREHDKQAYLAQIERVRRGYG